VVWTLDLDLGAEPTTGTGESWRLRHQDAFRSRPDFLGRKQCTLTSSFDESWHQRERNSVADDSRTAGGHPDGVVTAPISGWSRSPKLRATTVRTWEFLSR
jgi:hypothetical protein